MSQVLCGYSSFHLPQKYWPTNWSKNQSMDSHNERKQCPMAVCNPYKKLIKLQLCVYGYNHHPTTPPNTGVRVVITNGMVGWWLQYLYIYVWFIETWIYLSNISYKQTFWHLFISQILIKFAVDGGCHMWAGNAYSSGAPDSAPWTLSWGSILVFYLWNLTNLRVFKSWPDGCLSVLIVYHCWPSFVGSLLV